MGQAKLRKEEIDRLKRQEKVPNVLSFQSLQLGHFNIIGEIAKVLKMTEKAQAFNTSVNDEDFEAIFPTNLPGYGPMEAGFFMAFMDRDSYPGPDGERQVQFEGKEYKCLAFKDVVVLCTYCSHNFAKEHMHHFHKMRNTQKIAYSTPRQCQVLAEFPIR